MKLAYTLLVSLILTGCLSSEKQVQQALESNPEIIFKVIEDNPEKFVDAVNRAVRKAQQAQSQNRQQDLEQQVQEDLKSPKRPELQADRTLVGKPGAEIVVVEYGDFQCPACAVGYQNFKDFKQRHQDRIQFVYKHMPLDMHPHAKDAALAYELIRMESADKALTFVDEAFSAPGRLEDAKDLAAIVKKAGFDWKTLQKSKNVAEAKKRIQADMQEFQKFGFNGTPSFIMNGVSLPGAQPASTFDRVLELTSTKK